MFHRAWWLNSLLFLQRWKSSPSIFATMMVRHFSKRPKVNHYPHSKRQQSDVLSEQNRIASILQRLHFFSLQFVLLAQPIAIIVSFPCRYDDMMLCRSYCMPLILFVFMLLLHDCCNLTWLSYRNCVLSSYCITAIKYDSIASKHIGYMIVIKFVCIIDRLSFYIMVIM